MQTVTASVTGRTFKIGLKIPHMSAYNFGGSGPSLTKLYQVTWLEAGVIKWTLIYKGCPLLQLPDGDKMPPSACQ